MSLRYISHEHLSGNCFCKLLMIDIVIATKGFTIGSLPLIWHRFSNQVCCIIPHEETAL